MRHLLLATLLLVGFSSVGHAQGFSKDITVQGNFDFRNTWSEADVGAGRWDEGHLDDVFLDPSIFRSESFWIDAWILDMMLAPSRGHHVLDISNGV